MRRSNKQKNNLLPKALGLTPLFIIMFSAMFPGIGLLNKWLNPEYIPNSAIVCNTLPGELVGLILLSEYFILLIWKFFLPKVNNALFFMSYGAFSAFAMGSVFFLVANVAIFCPPLTPEIFKIYPFICAVFALLIGLIFVFQVKRNIRKAMKMNTEKINFKEMIFSVNAPQTHISGKKLTGLLTTVMAAGLVGLYLAKSINKNAIDNHEMLTLASICILITSYFIAYHFLGQLYSIWIVHSKSKLAGRKMTIKELNQK